MTEETTHCRTFLGHVLSIGDTALGLDLRNSNVNNPELEKLSVDKVGHPMELERRSLIWVIWLKVSRTPGRGVDDV